VVVSHDRYFLERVTDSVWALMGDGQIAMLPGGVDQYLEQRKQGTDGVSSGSQEPRSGAPSVVADERQTKKALSRIEKQLARVDKRERELHQQMAEAASDHERLTALSAELDAVTQEKEALEQEWLETASLLE
jgi:ATP-binding cassette subfamily F protein uup